MSPSPGQGRGRIRVAITNYDFSDNADRLYAAFSRRLPTVLIDSSSPRPPRSPHVAIPNSYYPGLWNRAVEAALEAGDDWLMFVASDLRIDAVDHLCALVEEASTDARIGVYTPSLERGSRCFFPALFNGRTASTRVCGLVEGFFFLARTEILTTQYPIAPANRYGWGVDVAVCYAAHLRGQLVVVDDRVSIFHPPRKPEHAIDVAEARASSTALLAPGAKNWFQDLATRSPHDIALISPRASLVLGCGPQIVNRFAAQVLKGVDDTDFGHPDIVAADLRTSPIPFADASFDYVTVLDPWRLTGAAADADEGSPPLVALIGEARRVLRPGGLLLLATHPGPPGPRPPPQGFALVDVLKNGERQVRYLRAGTVIEP